MSQDCTYCFIINCASNSFKAESFFRSKEHFLESEFKSAEFIYIQKRDSIALTAQKKAEQFTHVVACGGDGTVNQVANGLIGTKAVMGVIPMGSGNDFAQSIGLGKDFDEHISVLKTNKVRQTDAIETTWGYFINTYGIGVDGLTNYYAAKSRFKKGTLKYFIGGLQALFFAKPFKINLKVDGNELLSQPLKTWMVVVANGKSEGGKYKISPNSINHDGKVEIIIVKAVSRIRLVTAFIKLSLGLGFSKALAREFVMLDTCTIKASSSLRSHADGEQIQKKREFKFTNLKSVLPVIVK